MNFIVWFCFLQRRESYWVTAMLRHAWSVFLKIWMEFSRLRVVFVNLLRLRTPLSSLPHFQKQRAIWKMLHFRTLQGILCVMRTYFFINSWLSKCFLQRYSTLHTNLEHCKEIFRFFSFQSCGLLIIRDRTRLYLCVRVL